MDTILYNNVEYDDQSESVFVKGQLIKNQVGGYPHTSAKQINNDNNMFNYKQEFHSQQYTFQEQGDNYKSGGISNQYPSQLSFQAKQSPIYQPLCKIHKIQRIQMLCMAQRCTEFSRLVCLGCIKQKMHLQHINECQQIDQILQLQPNEYLSNFGDVSDRIQEMLINGFHIDDIEKIQGQLEGIQMQFHQKFMENLKSILSQVDNNNGKIREKLDESTKDIFSTYSSSRLVNSLNQFLKGDQSQQSQTRLEATISEYADLYHSVQRFEAKLPQSELNIDHDKFAQVEYKLAEALQLLSEIVVRKDKSQVEFLPSSYRTSSKQMKVLSMGAGILCLSKDEPMVAFNVQALAQDAKYVFKFKVDDMKGRFCWGPFIVKDRYYTLTDGLCWPTEEKGLFCCFDGDCGSTKNCLKSNTPQMQFTEKEFTIEIHLAAKLFNVKSASGSFSYSLRDPSQIDKERYYLGFALQSCKLECIS